MIALYILNLKLDTNELSTKQKQTHRSRKTDLWSPKGGRCEDGLALAISRYKLLYRE